ncbi:MAG: GDSL-type esterase/lipase family protein [Christensenellaceae bacterium]
MVLCIGFNDVWRQFDTPVFRNGRFLWTNIEKISTPWLMRRRPETIWMTPYYLGERKRRHEKRMDEYRAAMKEIAAERGIPCIDLQEKFVHILQYRYPRLSPGTEYTRAWWEA